jgi:hypothetical protein
MVQVTAGRLNKQIAHHIGIANHAEGASHEFDAEDEGVRFPNSAEWRISSS